MTRPVITFVNNRSGTGNTFLVYHLSWMLAESDKRVVVVDLDPQAGLTTAFLDEEKLETIWEASGGTNTIFKAIEPLIEGINPAAPVLQKISSNLYLLPGDISLSRIEEILAANWQAFLNSSHPDLPLGILTAFWKIMQTAAEMVDADILLVDTGPGLGAINHSALIASDFIVIALSTDIISLSGLKSLGIALHSWRCLWKRKLETLQQPGILLPRGDMKPAGYVCRQSNIRWQRPAIVLDKWINRVPAIYRESILCKPPEDLLIANDPCCLAIVNPYRSLISIAIDHRKPIFKLTSADGAIGSHAGAVQESLRNFKELSGKISAIAETASDRKKIIEEPPDVG